MKKAYILLLSSLVLGGMLVGCNNNNTPEDAQKDDKKDEGKSDPTPSEEEKDPEGDKEPGGEDKPGEGEGEKEPGGEDKPSEGGDDPVTPPHQDEDEDYVVKVTAADAVHYTVSHQRAKKGETVTFTITSIDEGYSLKEVALNGNTLNGVDGVYTFEMPNRPALITVSLNAVGDVTLFGDIAATLQKEGDIYVARNVKVETDGDAKFSYKVKDNNNVEHILDSGDLDERKCFADVTFYYGSAADMELTIASNCTYDFYYDPAAQFPCYIIRTSVDYLPSDEKGLYSLFDGTYRSEPTLNYPELRGIHFTNLDKSNADEVKKYDFNYEIYENNISFATVHDQIDEKDFFVYKEYDEENELLEIVDTFTKARGNNDRSRLDKNFYGAYSGRFDVVPLDSDDNNAREFSKREAIYTVNHSAHYGKELESEIQDCYRVGFSRDELTASDLVIDSEKNGDEIVVSITSFKEFNSSAGKYTVEWHEGYMYDVTIKFDAAGRLTDLDYLETKFTKSEWDFQNHKPGIGQEGSVYKRLQAEYTYGAPKTGTPEFDKSKYFISSIDSLQFYNEKTGKEDDGTSQLHYADKVYLGKRDADDKHETLKSLTYSPATALDAWEYGPMVSSNEDVIAHLATDYFDQMTCQAVGTSTVTFGNFTKASGITKDVDITVSATQKFHSIYLYSAWGEYPSVGVISSDEANITAGEISSFKVSVTPDTAPVVYDAVCDRPDLVTITQHDSKLTLDATAAASLKEVTTVHVTCTSDWFQDAVINKYKVFTFHIIPAAVNPVGTKWGMNGAASHAQVEFTTTAYEGEMSSYIAAEYEGAKVGHIVDDGYDPDTQTIKYAVLDIEFFYVYKKGEIKAKISKINTASDKDGSLSKDKNDYSLDFYYDATTDQLGVGLCYQEYDSDIEDFYIYDIYGKYDDGFFTEYTAYNRLAN